MTSFVKLDLHVFHSALLEIKHDEIALDSCGLNQPALRKIQILSSLKGLNNDFQVHINSISKKEEEEESSLVLARNVHDARYIDFLETAWLRWSVQKYKDPDFFVDKDASYQPEDGTIPTLIPGNGAQRDASARPGSSVSSQCTFYVTDDCAPIFAELLVQLVGDQSVIKKVINSFPLSLSSSGLGYASYALITHPGHHAARASAAGYCYINQTAIIADSLIKEREWIEKVAIIDIDYHCGNGTIGIFWENKSVLVVSIHADPEIEYPYNCGFADQYGGDSALNATLCLPLPGNTNRTNHSEIIWSSSTCCIFRFRYSHIRSCSWRRGTVVK